MTSREVARSIRFRKFARHLAVIGGMTMICMAATAVHAQQLQWKTPNVAGAQQRSVQRAISPLASQQQQQQAVPAIQLVQHAEPVPYRPTFAPLTPPLESSTTTMVAQGKLPPVVTPNTPSPTAIIDTIYPESRPSYLSPSTSMPVGPVTAPPKNLPQIPLGEPEYPPEYPTDSLGGLDASDYTDSGNMLITSTSTCPDPRLVTKPMNEIGYDISMTATNLPQDCPINYGEYVPRSWQRTCFHWTASALCTKGAYFEDVDLERYGHSWGPLLQPVISGGKFFLTVPLLPYKMGLVPPSECVYTLGHYRPGSCAPYMIDPLPISVRAGLLQAGAIVGGVYIIP